MQNNSVSDKHVLLRVKGKTSNIKDPWMTKVIGDLIRRKRKHMTGVGNYNQGIPLKNIEDVGG